MKNLVIIMLLFMFSCTQVERVGNERVYLNRDEPAEKIKETPVVEKVVEEIPVVEEKVDEPIILRSVKVEHYDMSKLDEWETAKLIKYLKPSSEDGDVVKLVALLKTNAYGIRKVWYTIEKHNDGKVLEEGAECKIVVTVQTVGSSMDTFETQFKKEESAVGSDKIHIMTNTYTQLVERKFMETLELLLNNSNE